ncbi:MshA, mannose-sensitive hemaglutinin [Vibrio ichthyoenteri ATCC 700023]|uniref:MshA, mannose-sensitive hemaglutinin n=1 Tax=Vibrio ichthyoenteri ATCC 700023 TaxID=870968 RepID=F9S8E2_9VIBR|nr:MshA, mannose-sensitive hemaglutinin [Vibrio ichthyoenteri ATCC 700023]
MGFTLIELVVVIVVLGILAVTAMPRLVNLHTDSRIAALNGLKAGMQSANDMIYPLAIQQGLANLSSATITIEGDPIQLAYGYPAAFSRQTWSQLIEANFVDAIFHPNDPADWYFHNNPSENWIRFMTKSRIDPSLNCLLRYEEATASTPPRFEFVTQGC